MLMAMILEIIQEPINKICIDCGK